jgi:protein SCO1/2
MKHLLAAAMLAVLTLAACRRGPEPKRYELNGQILAIAPERREVTIRHKDIEGFMVGMTMPFPVESAALLEGKQPGDLVTATLVVGDKVYLSALSTTGHAPIEAPPPGDHAAILREGELLADELLVDQDGASHPMATLRGHRVALTFIYTRCPDPTFCPLMNRNFATLQKALAADRALADVRLVTVTLDPEHDTPPVLKAHAKVFGADPSVWTFLTGDPAEVKRFGEQFGLHAQPDADAALQIVHNLRTVLIGADGRLVKAYSGNEWTPTELLADLKATPAPSH